MFIFENIPTSEMIRVEGGSFMMGDKKDHEVTVAGFWIGKYPVTQELWEFVMKSESLASFQGKNRPVEQVSWFDAVIFCNKLSEMTDREPCYFNDKGCMEPFGKIGEEYVIPEEQDDKTEVVFNEKSNGFRLPLEKEWEFAAKGGTKSKEYDYAGGHDLDDVGWYDENSHGETKPVGLKLENELSLYDMSGNVWEWCEDWYSDARSYRVSRGGSWYSNDQACRPSFRNFHWPADRDDNIGFRLVLSL